MAKLGYACYERTGFTEVSNAYGIGVGVDFFFLNTAAMNPQGLGSDLGKGILFGEEVHWLEHQRVELYVDYIPSLKVMNWIHPWSCSQVWDTVRRRRGDEDDEDKCAVNAGQQERLLVLPDREIAHPSCLPRCGELH
ncbi:unnamed protein product, partial [Amoebophrya sp. A25]|eukprot:GSA25T00007995001.1